MEVKNFHNHIWKKPCCRVRTLRVLRGIQAYTLGKIHEVLLSELALVELSLLFPLRESVLRNRFSKKRQADRHSLFHIGTFWRTLNSKLLEEQNYLQLSSSCCWTRSSFSTISQYSPIVIAAGSLSLSSSESSRLSFWADLVASSVASSFESRLPSEPYIIIFRV